MADTFTKFFNEKYEPMDYREKKFVAKHKVQVTDYPVKQKQKDVEFKAVDTKMVNRHTMHGNNPGEDAAQYEDFLGFSDEELDLILDTMTVEEFDQLDELSKATLGRYVQKAAKQMGDAAWSAGARHGAGKSRSEIAPAAKHERKRKLGIYAAVDKLAKEETDLQELSKKTLGSYVHKASMHAASQAYEAGSNSASSYNNVHSTTDRADKQKWAGKYFNKASSRLRGIKKASERLAREETELQELSKGTLARYIDSASTDRHNKAFKAGEHWNRGDINKASPDLIKSVKRGMNIAKAAKKLAKEEAEQIDEISSETRDRYLTKAMHGPNSEGAYATRARKAREKAKDLKDVDDEGHDSALKTMRNSHRKMVNRGKGIDRALEKKYAFGEGRSWSSRDDNDDSLRAKGGAKTYSHRSLRRQLNKIRMEAAQLDEISPGTLARYTMHAAADVKDRKWDMTEPKGRRQVTKKINNRLNGMTLAAQKLAKNPLRVHAKEETDLQELSRKTLASYIRTSANTMRGDEADRQYSTAQMRHSDSDSDYKRHSNIAHKATTNIQKRWRGITNATKKLSGDAKVNAKEETELQEISAKLAGNYIRKAASDLTHRAAMTTAHDLNVDLQNPALSGTKHAKHHSSESEKHARKAIKRETGIIRAASKLTGTKGPYYHRPTKVRTKD